MKVNQVSALEFAANAQELLRQVEVSGESMVVTDNGKPTIEVRPYRTVDRNSLEILRGSVLYYGDPTAPVDVD